ncbi:MAG: 30S ribosomal protein S3ae [Fervidicoccaceae archaeon]
MSQRATAREKKRAKKWYVVTAPPAFGGVVIGTTPSDDPQKLLGRVIEVSLYDITGDYTRIHVKLKFQVISVEGDEARTMFKSHELARDYIKVLTRRKSSKIQGILDVRTKEGYALRVTALAFTSFRCKTSQKRAIRAIMRQLIERRASEQTLDEFVQSMLFDKLATEIFEQAKKIYPLRRVEIYKSKLLEVPTPEGPRKAVVTPYSTAIK